MSLRSMLLGFLCQTLVVISLAQSNSKGIFIISSDPSSPIQYTQLRMISGSCNALVKDVCSPEKKYSVFSNSLDVSESRQKASSLEGLKTLSDTLKTPFGGSVASLAYDQRTNRLFYFPTFASELRIIDLNHTEPRFTYLSTQSLNLLKNRNDIANQISRMTIGQDGYGYALTNDGEHLIRFSTQKQTAILDLGALVDHPDNSIFVKSGCTSWGGDMVADQDGRLILITQSNYVFSITIGDRVAKYLGQIEGLPVGFTTNGVAVDENGDLILSCGSSRTQNLAHHLFRLRELNNLRAEVVQESNIPGIGNISDMASSYILSTPKQVISTVKSAVTADSEKKSINASQPIYSLFPNPVSSGTFSIRAQNITDLGEYLVSVFDLNGRVIMERTMNVGSKVATHSFTLPSHTAKGVYVVLVADYFKRAVFSTQFIVE